MKKIRIKRSVLNIFVVIVIGVLAALCLDRMVDDFVNNILFGERDYMRRFLAGGDSSSTLYGWHNDEAFSDGGYYYERADEDLKIAYQVVYKTITERNGETPLGTNDRSVIMDAYNYVTYDHPEIFYTAGYDLTEYTFESGKKYTTFTVKYTEDEQEQEYMEHYISLYANSILEKVNPDWDDYEKIKFIYNRIIKETSYDLENSNAYNIYAIAHDHEGVCEGYAKMFKYLLDRMGIPCIVVPGFIRSNGSNHIWNAVYVDNAWYFVDSTWGDVQFDGNGKSEGIRYDYFCVTEDEITTTHVIDPYIPLPKCNEIEDNYFVREGLSFSTLTDEHVELIVDMIKKTGYATFRCADAKMYEEAYEKFVLEDVIHFNIGFDTKIKYSVNKNVRTLTFWVAD